MAAIRQLTPADRSELELFLTAHAAQAMFLRSNLARSGIVDGDLPYQGCYAGAYDGERLVGAGALYWNGFLILLAREYAVGIAQMVTSGRRLAGIIGPLDEVDAVRQALAAGRPTSVDSPEDLFRLPLERLQLPRALRDGALDCRLAEAADLPLLAQWRLDFDIALNGVEISADAEAAAWDTVGRWIDEQAQFVLLEDGHPVAACCYNARLPDMVQIGSVWVPEPLRGQGYARAVVAGALRHAQDNGVAEGILFTAKDNHFARRAYLALGFSRVSDYAIVIFAD